MPLVSDSALRIGRINWDQAIEISPQSYECGWCGRLSGSNKGFVERNDHCRVYACTYCGIPTVFYKIANVSSPHPTPGDNIKGLPDEVDYAWAEARSAMSVGAFTAAAQMCRKILMNTAVDKGAKEGLRFVEYVDWLAEQSLIPPHAKEIADHIRRAGNVATHEIVRVDSKEGMTTLSFTQSILQIVYELPALLPGKSSTSEPDE